MLEKPDQQWSGFWLMGEAIILVEWLMGLCFPDVDSKYGGTLLELWMQAKQIKFPEVMQKPYKQLQGISK